MIGILGGHLGKKPGSFRFTESRRRRLAFDLRGRGVKLPIDADREGAMPTRGRLAAFSAMLALLLGPPALAQPIGAGPPGGLSPAACNGHGQINLGRCFCDPGWSGAECGGRERPLACGAHGRASNGWCVCEPGWKGHACETAPPTCVHGKPAHGKCACDGGWSGDACDRGP
jgi:hypothetical protein